MKQYDDNKMKSRFPIIVFVAFFVVLLLMSGVHVGLIVLMNKFHLSTVIQCILPMLYWSIVALVLTGITRQQVKATYEEPMQNLAIATKKVANGDFSVYVPTINTADRLDYLDRMIIDFNKMVEELGSIETLKTDFVSNVSHEMRTPLAIIRNYGELLKQEHVSDEKRKEYAAVVEDAAVRLSDLIGNILKLNKLENQRIIPEAEIYDVSRQLCDCILQFEDIWEVKDIDLDVDLEESVYIQADASLLELVWNNLLSNALKFTEKGGSISICQKRSEGQIQISISDTGCGMSKDNLKHIFDKFYQGDTSRAKEGNGLGLALVKRVVELVDGEIRVESEEGEGSTFMVILPEAKYDRESGGGQ